MEEEDSPYFLFMRHTMKDPKVPEPYRNCVVVKGGLNGKLLDDDEFDELLFVVTTGYGEDFEWFARIAGAVMQEEWYSTPRIVDSARATKELVQASFLSTFTLLNRLALHPAKRDQAVRLGGTTMSIAHLTQDSLVVANVANPAMLHLDEQAGATRFLSSRSSIEGLSPSLRPSQVQVKILDVRSGFLLFGTAGLKPILTSSKAHRLIVSIAEKKSGPPEDGCRKISGKSRFSIVAEQTRALEVGLDPFVTEDLVGALVCLDTFYGRA